MTLECIINPLYDDRIVKTVYLNHKNRGTSKGLKVWPGNLF